MSAPGRQLKILIADPGAESARQLAEWVSDLGHQALLTSDAPSALTQFRADTPDLVFLDIQLALESELPAVQGMRAIPGEKWIPIILCATLEQMPETAHGLAAGGDDYVIRPVTLPLLKAKIEAYARLLAMQQALHTNSEELKGWRADAEEQNRLGAHVMERLTAAEGLRDTMLQHFNIPADTFSGDLLCASRAPGEVFNVMLADAAGHGLAAALTAMPLTQAFYSMTAKGFPLSSIAEELNRKLKALLPADRFVAATLVSVDVRNQTVEIWNGGNPDALFINHAGRVATRWASNHPPLGILPEKLFSGQTETLVFQEPGDLILCSDGLAEAENPAGEWLGLEGVVALLGSAQGGEQVRFNRLREGLMRHLGQAHGRDDISCMALAIPVERRQAVRVAAPGRVSRESIAEWRLDLSYGAQELRYIDVVPAVLGFVTQVNALKPHQGALFLIVSELFNNALDHGLLGLDSATKEWIGGFDVYMQQRWDRLAGLREGRIDLSFQMHQEGQRAVLDIALHDTGPGFDFEGLFRAGGALEESQRSYGRGVALVRNLCADVVYSGTGNKVWVRYVLAELDTVRADVDHALPAE